MALNSLGLGFLFTGTDLASGVMQGVNKNFKGLEAQAGTSIGNIDEMTKKLGAGLATTAIGIGGLAATFSLAGKAGEFEQALAAVGAVSNASAAELENLKAAAIKAGVETQFSPTMAVKGLNELAQAGYSSKESIELLDPVLKLAAGSLGDLSPQDAAGVASQALKAFGIDAKFAGRAVDQLLQSANAFAMRPADLALGLGTVSSGAQTLNQSLTETAIAFGLVKNIIPGTERAATAVKVAMERLANPKVQKVMKAHHIAITDQNGDYREFLDIMKDMMPQLDKMTEKDKGAFLMEAFGTEGLSGVNAMMTQFTTGLKGADGVIRKGGDAIDYLRKQFREANGVADEFAKKLLDTFDGAKTLLGGSMETLAILIGEPFKDIFRPVVEMTTGAVNLMIAILQSINPDVLRFGAGIIVASFALLTLIGTVLLVSKAWPLLVEGFGLLTTTLGGLATAAWAAIVPFLPFIAIAAAVAVGIAAIVYAIKHNLGGLGTTWDRVADTFSSGGQIVSDVFKAVGSYVGELWGALKEGFGQMFDTFGPIFEDVGHALDMLMDAFAELGGQFNNTSRGPGEGLLGFFQTLGKAIAWVVGTIVSLISWIIVVASVVVQVVTFVVGMVRGMFEELMSWIDGIMYYIDKATAFADRLRGIDKADNRGLGDDRPHANDAGGRTSKRGLGDGKPELAGLADQGTMTPLKTAPVAAASASAMPAFMYDQGSMIDYDKMAAANAKQPINVNLNVDSEKLASVSARGARSAAARASGHDAEER